ncbi:MAG: site-specific integrase [Chitinophagaceae bacterium]
MVSKTFSLLFYIKKQKNSLKEQPQQENKKQPIYIRITVNGKRIELSAKREVDPTKWNSHAGRAIGTKEEIKTLNAYLDTFQMKLYEAQRQLLECGKPFTAESLKNKMTGKEERPRMLVEIIQQHNDSIKTLIGLDYSKATWVKYNTTQKHIEEFLQWKYQTKDINIRDLNFEFINDFEFYLKSQKKIDVNTNAKYLKNIKKIVNECVAKDWLDKDPFVGYKIKTKHTERGYLNEFELKDIEEKEFAIERLNYVRDIFLFSCYTGLAYVDIFNLRKENISIGMDGEKWIFTHRQKTETPSRIPLLPKALAIMEKYAGHPKTVNENKVLPVPSNQKVNAYLKEIADCCGIKKELTFHIARHTFATTITLNNGVSLESVSKMLGHKKFQTTQIYAKILDKKVSNDMTDLRQRLKAI